MRTIAAVVIIAAFHIVSGYAQSLTGKWLGHTPDGAVLGLDLTVTGSTLAGTFILMRDGQSIPIPITDTKMKGSSFTFRVVVGADGAAFSGEQAADRLTLRALSSEPKGPPVVLTRVADFPETRLAPVATTAPASAPAGWRAYNRAATLVPDARREIVHVDERLGDGVIWLDGVEMRNGMIEVELRGANRPGQSFVGVAFRGADDRTYEAVYFRPFNFQAGGPGRQRAVQYVSHPDHPWARLRAAHPGQFEHAVSPVPDPDDWFHARIALEGSTVSVFVNDASTPTLVINALTEPRGGKIGLWVGNGSGGDFANLRVMDRD